MSSTVRIPTPLRPLAQGRGEVEVQGRNVREALDHLEGQCAGMRARICDEKGELRRFVNLFLNDEDIRYLQGLESEVKDGDVLSIVPAIAGGRREPSDAAGERRKARSPWHHRPSGS
jgi:sulfur-carrier protein